MTRAEADVILYLVDQLKERGATVVDVAGVKANFAPKPDAPPEERKKPAKTFHERLFRHLPKDAGPPTRAERLKRKSPEA